MDQVKEFLRQAVKYRFWIAVGVSAILPLIAYFAAAGSLKAETETESAKIKTAYNDVKQYQNGVLPNQTYSSLTNERTEVLTKDVDGAWRKLYARQAPLLTWPSEVSLPFQKWGEQWPKEVDQVQIANAINDWVQIYPAYVTQVYNSFRPFDYTAGTGVVAAPSEADLLHPVPYTVDDPPSLGKVWAAQKKLWIEGVVLDVINKVNGDAEDWDSAVIKEVKVLEVANFLAQDQRSIARGEKLKLAPEIVNPQAPPSAAASGGGGGGGGGGMTPGPMGSGGIPDAGGQAGAMSSVPGSMFGAGMGAAAKVGSDEVYVLQTKTPATQYDIIPVHLAVLIDQNRIPDLIVGFQNSPMAIQVLDFEMNVPLVQVKKPVKGEERPMGMGGMMGMMGGMQGMMAMQMQGMQGMQSMTSNMMAMPTMTPDMMSGMMGGLGAAAPKRKGTDVSKEHLKAILEAERKAKSKGTSKDGEEEEVATKRIGSRNSDPYFNIVEVRVYGQARFYKAPPPLPETPDSASQSVDGTPAQPADAAKAEAPKAEAPKAEAPETKADEAEPKAEAPETKTEAPKAEADAPETKADEAEPKAEASETKAEAPETKADEAEPKAEAPETKADEAEPKTEEPPTATSEKAAPKSKR